MSIPSRSSILFGLVVVLGVAQVTWWILFQFREAQRLETAGQLLADQQVERALHVLGADETGDLAETVSRRRTMFATEGAALGLVVLIGVVFFYSAMHRERRIRQNQERFLTGATHELKTPLATLRLGLESLVAGTLPEEKRSNYLHNMLIETDRLRRGLDNLLTAAGLEASRRLRLEQGDLADDVRSVADDLRRRAEAAGIEVHVDATDCPIARDEVALRLALVNLLDNAIKYSEPGARVDVKLRREGDRAKLLVRDTGRGIAAKDLPHVFDRFYRSNSHRHIGGTGLGLHLVRTIVQDHGGSVVAHSDGVGEGASIEIDLPVEDR